MSVAVPNPAPAASVSSSRRAAVDRARDGWISRLIDLSQRNNLLYFRQLKVGTLDLTSADRAALGDLLSGKTVGIYKLLPQSDRVKLTAQIKGIARKARENFEERGLETLFLAAGMATWQGEEGKRAPESAVLLVPITINIRDRAGPTLKRSGEPQVNPVLLHVLSTNFRCTIDPEQLLEAADTDPDRDDDPFNLDALLSKLDELGRGIAQFGVRRTCVLGNFFFQKMAMVRDLRELGDQLAANDVIAGLAGDVEAQQRIAGSGAADVDARQFDHVPPEKEFLVLDTDSSQHKAIALATGGASTVIQGPPGTGKSQVIANLIVTAAAEGKRVLFVAEKRAALQVVLDRLARVGLGHLALDLHGADTSRKVIAGRIRAALEYISKGEPIVSEAMLSQFVDRRRRLNAHVERMHTPRQPSGLSVFQLQGRLLRFECPTQLKTRFRGGALLKLDSKAVAQARDLLARAADLGPLFLGTDSSPWAKSSYTDGHEVQSAMDLAARLADDRWPRIKQEIIGALSPLRSQAPKSVAEAESLLATVVDVDALLHSYKVELFNEDLPALIAALAPAERGAVARLWASMTSSRYRAAKQTMLRHALKPPTPQQMVLDALKASKLAREWRGGQFNSGIPVASNGAAAPALQALREFCTSLEKLNQKLGGDDLTQLGFEELDQRLAALRDDSLTPRKIPSLRQTEDRLNELGLAPLVTELRQTSPAGSTWAAAFEWAWLQSCLDHALAEDPELAAFSGPVHERYVAEFCEMDRQRLKLAARRVESRHVSEAVKMLAGLGSQASLVRREAEKKIRHLPFRKLMEQSPDVLAALFPCFMCSPLSVSQLLPGDRKAFDIVVFDEASQVLPEDAVPSLLRGAQAVVAGDQHQLPPTPFFADGGEDADGDGEPDEIAATEGFESLLSMMSAFVPAPMLEWHYRSRDERLITFSNQHIYSGRLITFPSPGGRVAAVGHVQVNESDDSGGNTDSSSAEVRRVVELVLQHAEQELQKPDPQQRRSLGVIALGIGHARRVESAIERALEAREDLDEFFDPTASERFFVKNLERVQGDERDVIMLTLGIAPDPAGRVSLLRFGPLNNREHGYRRLNVAVTRARYRMMLISSFSHHAINPSGTMSRGMELLRQYLQYTADGGRLADGTGSGHPLNEFEADVADALLAKGISTVPQWGASGYRIDLVAQHPSEPGRFVMAIECDGANYHSAPTARDRDRLRQQHLEALGWKFHRIWSTDWFTRRDAELQRVLHTYEEALKRGL